MITKRTKLLQILTDNGWQWVFCWSVSDGKIITTEDYRKAIPGSDSNWAYFQNRTERNLRVMKPYDI